MTNNTFANDRTATTTAPAATCALDDPHLLGSLVRSAKSAHSSLGRALDATLSHQRFGGAEMQPSALTMRRLERERQLRLQQDLQRSCGDNSSTVNASMPASTRARATAATKVSGADPAASSSEVAMLTRGGLRIPALPTMAPSMTAAADDGTESLGGTKLGSADRGYVTLIGAVPTFSTTRQVEDNYELISSFRAYRTDAQRTERQTVLRDVSAPHPDLLEQLVPLLQQRDTRRQPALADMETLPYSLRQAYAAHQRGQHGQQQPGLASLEAGSVPPSDALAAQETAAQLADAAAAAAAATAGREVPAGGTWSFTCQGRAAADRAKSLNSLPGQRQPVIGQYNVRHATVEPRVTGGYITPQATAGAAALSAGQQVARGSAGVGAEGSSNGEHRAEGSVVSNGDRSFGGGASMFGQTL